MTLNDNNTHISNNHLPLGELKNNLSLNYALSDSHFIILMLLNTINPLPKNTSVMKLTSFSLKKKPSGASICTTEL